MSSTGLFLVCFESSNLEVALARNEYYSRVGTYLDLVNQTAAVAGIKPKIMLVATKVENPEECQESLDKVLSMAKAQLSSVSSESFLVDLVDLIESGQQGHLCGYVWENLCSLHR